MKNEYHIEGNIVVIHVKRRDGTMVYGKIDLDDLNKVIALNRKIFSLWSPTTQSYYLRFRLDKDNSIPLHRFIMNAKDGEIVDHIDHCTENCCKSNLRIADRFLNGFNRKGAMKNSKSGVRGVSWYARDKKWQAKFKVNGKYVNLGMFKSIEEAKQRIEEEREKYA